MFRQKMMSVIFTFGTLLNATILAFYALTFYKFKTKDAILNSEVSAGFLLLQIIFESLRRKNLTLDPLIFAESDNNVAK